MGNQGQLGSVSGSSPQLDSDPRRDITPVNKAVLLDKDYDPITFDMLKVKPEDFANQITIIDLASFKRITSEELSSGAWSRKNKRTAASNIMNFTDRFNSVCLWCQREVLSNDKPAKRAAVIAHFVKIAKRLSELNNLHSTFAIVSALQSHPIHRLTKTWNCVGRHEKSTFEKLALLFDSERNWERLRRHLDQLKLPCIPYLGLYLTDLNFIDAQRSNENSFLEGSTKEQRVNNVIRTVAHFQDSNYDNLQYTVCIQKYLASFQFHEELLKFAEDDMYKQSLLREPDCPASTSTSALVPSDYFWAASLGRRIATLSRVRLNRTLATDKAPPSSLSVTPKLDRLERPAHYGHRKTQSVGSHNILGSENMSFTSDKHSTLDDRIRFSQGTDEADSDISTAVFYVPTEGERYLLDDSFSPDFGTVLDVDGLNARKASTPIRLFSRPEKICFSPLSLRKVGSEEHQLVDLDDSSFYPDWQGEVRKLIVRVRGSKPAKIRCSRRCFLELRGRNLHQFERRTLTIYCREERDQFRRKPSKTMVLSDSEWKVIAPRDDEDPSFELHHPASGRIYRFICDTHAMAVDWHSKLLVAGHYQCTEAPVNLISFD